MADSLIGRVGNNLLFRTIAVTIVVMGFFGVATGALPVRCLIGGACGVPVAPSAAPDANAEPWAAAPRIDPTAGKAVPTLTRNDVVAATFAQLKIDLKAPTPGGNPSPTRVATAGPVAAKIVTDPESGLARRVVRAVTIHADGSPDLSGTAAEAYAASRPLPLVPSPAVDAAARIGAGETPLAGPVQDLTPAVVAKPAMVAAVEPGVTAQPAVATGTAVVGGKGVNVRSSPSRGGGKVLFALNGGESVTVVESRRGWSRIKDDQGRVGWIYSEGLVRG